uniref:Aminotransferase-like plant mobile domain-containing protein n=1 Tax=Fagus sylvatica TaxID=28930 RepID=A0A2N9FWW5_FAGSY
MSGQGSGSGGQRRSDRLAKGKAVAYAPESSPDTDDEYDAIEGPRTRADSMIARNLQEHFDAEATGIAPREVRPPLGPGITIGGSARSSGASRRSSRTPTGAPPTRPLSKRQRADRDGIRPRYHVTTLVVDTPLMMNLINHPSSLVRRCEDPSIESTGRGGWSDFCKLLGDARQEYREFLTELGFGPFLSIPYVYVSHPLVRCWVERFFHHTGTFHLSTCEMGVLPVDWSAILGIRFGGRAPPSELVSSPEALDILGIEDPSAIEGTKSTSLRLRYLRDLLRREKDEPSIRATGALTYGFYIRGLRRFSCQETNGFLDFWQFILYWAFVHFPCFGPSRLPSTPDPAFPLARRWDSAWIRRLTSRTLLECRTTVDCIRDIDVAFQPYSSALVERTELFETIQLSRQRIWIRTPRSWELLMGERMVRSIAGGVGRSGCGDGPAIGGDGPVVGGVGPAVEGGGLSGCGAGCSGCKHSESRGSALELGYCPCY